MEVASIAVTESASATRRSRVAGGDQGQAVGVIVYTFEGNRAQGVWTLRGESQTGTENLAPMNSPFFTGRTCWCHLAAASLLAFATLGNAVEPKQTSESARAWRAQHEREILAEFASCLRFRTWLRMHANIERNAEAIRKMCEKRGLAVKLLTLEGAPPVVVADLARRTRNGQLRFTRITMASRSIRRDGKASPGSR